ncbi:uncharacterized protein BDR25DRAFT_208653 [Lindgomyces ingoldianus]|uniref:Uncharacterized protein n=1 Tax=Lindgomyces ingoldianus TaxID=673940 RepID=A0ACB6REG7_9PLEO|nr:uncharacterized protein BDR25DRAFT_208653 [Lindgomyces ingoldianus]KAF2476907.1 hypothetical protein BDR25DRAFT_208653 [Lindgomyces ingoldianus]
MYSLLSLLLATALYLTPTTAATWYFLRYNLPSSQSFLSFSGTMVIPKLPKAGVYYLWPGLQPTDNSGVYQNVLDGRSGTWWIGSGWCCSNPSLPWGSGFNVNAGDTVTFSNTRGSGAWTSVLKKGSSGGSVQDSFALSSKTFNQVLFAIELTSVSWDFGPLVFNNVVITSSGTDTKWCTNAPENYNSATNYAVSGVSASVSNNVVTCKINSVTLQSPKK